MLMANTEKIVFTIMNAHSTMARPMTAFVRCSVAFFISPSLPEKIMSLKPATTIRMTAIGSRQANGQVRKLRSLLENIRQLALVGLEV